MNRLFDPEILLAPVEQPTREQDDDTEILTQDPAKVILFDDDVHTFEEVIGQLIKALGCASTKAESLTWEVHSRGKAIVFDGQMDECLRVSGVLQEIALNTQIEV